MFATLSGTVKTSGDQIIVVEQSGIGFEIFVANTTLWNKDQQVFLHTYLHWSQENGPTLYGFQTLAEKTIFLPSAQISTMLEPKMCPAS